MTISEQCAKILEYMKRYGEISQRDAYKLGIYRLSARIFDLKQYGYKIITRTAEVTNVDGSTSRVGFYRLSEVETKNNNIIEAFERLKAAPIERAPISGKDGYKISMRDYQTLSSVMHYWAGGMRMMQDYVYLFDDHQFREYYLEKIAEGIRRLAA